MKLERLAEIVGVVAALLTVAVIVKRGRLFT